ncbi:MAG: ABC transporter permease [Acidobacteria bacterium]|nr:ABC transporter permease [Acidobacteriota bacterium]
MRRALAKFINLFRWHTAERELEREIEAHLRLLQDDFERRGMPPEEARLAARRSYGGVEQSKELHRQARSFLWVEEGVKDIRFGLRHLWRSPGFTVVAGLTLALGIGANTAIFSVVQAVLLEPLAYKDAGRLVTILHRGTGPVAPANYLDWRRQATSSFQAMGAAQAWNPNLTGIDQPETVRALQVTQSLLPMLGVEPALGRLFAAGEDQRGRDHEVVLSDRLWQRRFGGQPDVIGKQVALNGEQYTVVGVMPPSFQFAPFWATRTEMWVPLALEARQQDRRGQSLRIFARLNEGATLAQARAEIGAITARLEQQYPGTNRACRVTPLMENVVGKVETPLLLMMGAVALVLLIACANVAHMLLARASGRRKEFALRAALGAGRARLVRQLLTENLLLSALGAAAGLLLARWALQAIVALSPPNLPRIETVELGSSSLLFLLGATAATALLFGLAPALQTAAERLSIALKESGRGSGGPRGLKLRGFLVTSEFALALTLLVGAGLLMRSFRALQAVDAGFDPRGVLSMVVSVTGSSEAEGGRREIFYRQLLERVRALPGIEAAGAINHLPLAGDLWGTSLRIGGRPQPRPGEAPGGIYRVAMPGYFETMRIPLRRGRAFTDNDQLGAPGVAILNERAVAEFFAGENPIGQRISVGTDRPQPEWLTVVGVVADVAQHDWAARTAPEIYIAALQSREFLGLSESHSGYITLVARTRGNAADAVPALKSAVWALNRGLPISEVLTMEQALADATAQPRFLMLLAGLFAGIALVLAAVGIYGVMAYSVSRRTREIGIRMSLGADQATVLRMVLAQGMRQALLGVAAGLAASLVLSRLLERLLYGVAATDPLTFAVSAAVLCAAALLAACVPAARAVRVPPVTALREE